MSTITSGTQQVYFQYNNDLTAEYLNKWIDPISKAGIYLGGEASISSGNIVTIAAMTVVCKTATQESVHIKTLVDHTLTIAEVTPYITCQFSWIDSATNGMDFTAKTYASLNSSDIIIGKGIYVASTLTYIDYSERTNITQTDQTTTGWIPAKETWSYASTDSPTFTMTTVGDKTSKYSKGMKLRLEQEQALTNYWTFNTNSTESIAGVTMTDIGTPTYTAGKFGNALTLNGTDQALKCADNTFKPTGDFTIGCWVKLNDKSNGSIIFQSYNKVGTTNRAGFYIGTLIGNGAIYFIGGNNTGDIVNVNYSRIDGITDVTDNLWHYVVVTYKNNYVQIYVDGKLEISAYSITLVFDSTSYTRIGALTSDGTTYVSWFGSGNSGQIDDLFLIDGYALDEETIKTKYDLQTAQGVSNILVNKKFILTNISYTAPNTTLTLYGGTDHSLVSDSTGNYIRNPYYSMEQQPFGFNRDPNKWSVHYTNTVGGTQSSPGAGTIYNLGGSISYPIGQWIEKLRAKRVIVTSIATVIDDYISDSASVALNSYTTWQNATSIDNNMQYTITSIEPINITTKKTRYLLTVSTAAITSIQIRAIMWKITTVYL